VAQTNEKAFESYVELMLLDRGWQPGTNARWYMGRTIFTKVEAAIDRLQEYRTGLITAAVTGKIDVRGARA